jgi:hypothetical protein
MFFIFGIAILEYIICFRSSSHFFQGDTIHWFYVRHKTFSDFLHGFVTLDSGGWYRPLTNGSIQSLFFPVWGLTPSGYRVVQYVLFAMATIAVYKLAMQLTGRRLVTWLATLFFSFHTINAYTTYDLAFVPEIVYGFFYVCAVIFYLKGRRKTAIICFLLSLCSKEAAVTLPAMLVALDIIVNLKPVFRAIADARGHIALLAVYLVFVVGYLGVQRSAFESVINRPGPEVTYRFALDETIVQNADLALTWAFNIPRGWHTQWRNLDGWMIAALKSFRIVIALLAIWLMFRPERKLMLAGLAWFVIAIAPALPLFDHFFPYYLFLPLVGLSIAIAIILDTAYRKASTYTRVGAGLTLAATVAILFVVCATSIRNDARGNRMLGRSSTLALNSLNDLKARHPKLQPNTTIYLSNAEEPDLNWDTSQGAVFKLGYGDETIEALYWSWGEVITKGVLARGPVVVMKYHESHLVDITDEFLAASEPPVSYSSVTQHKLTVIPAAAAAGQNYKLMINGLSNTAVNIHYTVNGGPVRTFATHLDKNSETRLTISDQTEKGLYRFVGFQTAGTPDWTQAAATFSVQ